MKKLIAILAALLMAAPVMAKVTLTADQVGETNEVEILYSSTEGQPIRSISLDITVDNGAVIYATNDDYFTGECRSTEKGFGIFMSSINIDASGNVTNPGTPVSPKDILPSDTKNGLGTGGITIEMASLYDVSVPSLAPGNSGKLLSVFVDKSCLLCINPNVSRGGIVMENGQSSQDSPGIQTNMQACFEIIIPDQQPEPCQFDMNGDGVVNLTDYTDLLQKISLAKRNTGQYLITKDDPTTGSLYRECHDPDKDNDVDLINYTTLLRRISMAKRNYGVYEYQCGDAVIEAIW